MTLIVQTASGSRYEFDNDALTWARHNEARPDILHLEGITSGRLAAPVEPRVGQRLTFYLADHDWVCTSAVVSIEETVPA